MKLPAASSDKVLLGTALLAALVSAGVFGTLALQHRAPSGPPPAVQLADAPYAANAPEAPPVKTETWAPPPAQTRGREWVYDTFTPPEIFYNARSKQFTVKPPSGLADDEPGPFGLELVAVRPEPFRLQLIGFVGGEGNWRGMFQNVLSGETVVATTGHRIAKLGLTIRSFTVKPQPIRAGEGAPTNLRVAFAVVRDDKTGRETTLTHRDRAFTGTLSAFVAAPGETATREVRMGDTFKLGEATYHVEKISLSPPAVEVAKESPALSQTERQTLTPREADEPERPDGL